MIVSDFLRFHVQAYGAFVCIFYGVVEQIDDDLPDTDLITEQHRRNVRVDIYVESKSLLARAQPDHIYDLGDHISDLVIYRYDVHASGFYLGEIKDIVDQHQQHFTGALDIRGILDDLVGCVFLPQYYFVESQDRVDGRPYLVAHAREETVLAPGQFLGSFGLLTGFAVLFLEQADLEPYHDIDHDTDHDKRDACINKSHSRGMLYCQIRI